MSAIRDTRGEREGLGREDERSRRAAPDRNADERAADPHATREPTTHEPWHARSAAATAEALKTDPDVGLAPDEASRRLATTGRNEIAGAPARSPLAILGAQFTDFMILVLIAAAVLAGVIGEPADAIAIVVIVLLNGLIGFVQEYRAEAAVAALRKMASPGASIVRGGRTREIDAAELVPGDVVLLDAGRIVPADLRLASVAQLSVDESALTGESQPVEKTSEALDKPELPLADRRNLAFKGTVVTRGRGAGLVVATGMQTELGRIARLLEEQEDSRTPLQRRLAAFGRRLAGAVLAICAVIFVAGLLRGEPATLMFLTAISLAVAAIPEALPAVVTVALALGARRMVDLNALIRRLPAVETLGSVTCICSDKTGTLTRNRMQVEALVAANGATPSLLRAMALNNDTRIGPKGELVGDPTETALYVAARDGGADPEALAREMPRLDEIPFESDRKRMTTLHRDGSRLLALVKGAPESVLPLCTERLTGAGIATLDRDAALDEAEQLAEAGQRVLAYACRWLPSVMETDETGHAKRGALPWEEAGTVRSPIGWSVEAVERNLVFLGLAGLQDPPRDEAAPAVATCRSAGIAPVMITGDHPATARAIARKLGILDRGGSVLSGPDLARMRPETLEKRVGDVRVFARVDPEQKIRIVEALRARGEIVAMTGDGVNDAPALKRADIGVAMGRIGTDVAREASDMVLLDDNFATIVAAVREGRRIYDNIRKFIRFVMTGNAGEIWTLFLAPFLGMPIPLLPIQILWVNLVTDGLPGLALTLEPAERDVMRRPPRPPDESVFAGGTWQSIVFVGILIGGLSLAAQAWGLARQSAAWQTMVFTVLTFAQLFLVLAIRSETRSLASLGIATNHALLAAVIVSAALHLAIVYVPLLQPVFKTESMAPIELLGSIALAAVVLVAVEIEKWLRRRGWIYGGGDDAEAGRRHA